MSIAERRAVWRGLERPIFPPRVTTARLRTNGPAEFAVLWDCLGQWRMIFDKFDRDRSGKVDSEELKEALRSLGYAVPPLVMQIIMSNYIDSASGRGGLNFDNFVECGMTVKGITEVQGDSLFGICNIYI